MLRGMVALLCASGLAVAQQADLLLLNGKVLTLDTRDTVVEAVAISGGKILATGPSDALRRYRGPRTRIIDLHGRSVTPGLIDTHLHFQQVEAVHEIALGDPSVTRMDDVIRLVRAKAATLKHGEWVRGRGWDEGKLAERRYILASDLDKAAPDNPVYLTHTTGHYAATNSMAMKLAGITTTTKDPPAGTIDRDAKGSPTGVLKESAQGLVRRLVPGYTRDQEKAGLLKMIEELHKEGMTGAKDPGIDARKWELYRELLSEGKLNVRLMALWRGGSTLESARATMDQLRSLPKPPLSLGDGVLLTRGVKLFLDGSGGARTAWMHDDYNRNFKDKDTGNRGYPTTEPEVYRAQVKMLHDAGIHVSTHAIGDRAIDLVVDTYAAVLRDNPMSGLRHGIIHANTPTDHAIAEMARLQKAFDAGYPETQGTFLWWLGDNYSANLGPHRAQRLNPYQTYLRKSVKWGGGSDYPVTPFAARYSIWASTVRQPLKGTYGRQPFGMAEAIDVHAALRAQTAWAARQLFLEDRIGSIEAGKDADLAVWDQDWYFITPSAIKEIRCDMTLFRGQVVYQRNR